MIPIPLLPMGVAMAAMVSVSIWFYRLPKKKGAEPILQAAQPQLLIIFTETYPLLRLRWRFFGKMINFR
jgi:hypothetical protein